APMVATLVTSRKSGPRSSTSAPSITRRTCSGSSPVARNAASVDPVNATLVRDSGARETGSLLALTGPSPFATAGLATPAHSSRSLCTPLPLLRHQALRPDRPDQVAQPPFVGRREVLPPVAAPGLGAGVRRRDKRRRHREQVGRLPVGGARSAPGRAQLGK